MTTPPFPGPPPLDPRITASPEYERSYHHYLAHGSTSEDAARLAYDWTAALELGAFPPPPPGSQPVRAPKKHRKAKIIGGAVAAGILGVCSLGVALSPSTSSPPSAATGSSTSTSGTGVQAQADQPSPAVAADGGTFTDPKALADAVDARSSLSCGTYTAGTKGNWPSGSCDTLGALLVVLPPSEDPSAIAPQLAGASVVPVLYGRNWLVAFAGDSAASKAAALKDGLGGVVVTIPAKPSPKPAAPAPKPKPAAPTIPGDGTFIPGTDFPAGTYRTSGAPDGVDCYWARLRNLSGEMGSIIANDNVTGPTVVRIRASDAGFKTSGCGDWTKIG